MDDAEPQGGEEVAPVQVVLPVELGGVVGPAVGFDDDRDIDQLEVDAGDEVAVVTGTTNSSTNAMPARMSTRRVAA